MKKQLVIIGIIAILVSVGLSGCTNNSIIGSPDRNKFIGSWEQTSGMYMSLYSPTFESDGTLIISGIKLGTWTVKEGNRLEVTVSGVGGSSTTVYDYIFSDNDATLTTTAVGTSYVVVYHKKI